MVVWEGCCTGAAGILGTNIVYVTRVNFTYVFDNSMAQFGSFLSSSGKPQKAEQSVILYLSPHTHIFNLFHFFGGAETVLPPPPKKKKKNHFLAVCSSMS